MFTTLMLAIALNARPAPALQAAPFSPAQIEATETKSEKQPDLLHVAPCQTGCWRGLNREPLRVAPSCPGCFRGGLKTDPLRVAPTCRTKCERNQEPIRMAPTCGSKCIGRPILMAPRCSQGGCMHTAKTLEPEVSHERSQPLPERFLVAPRCVCMHYA